VSIATKAFRADSVAVSGDGLQLRVGLPWYRSLPWAAVAGVELELDGVDVGPAVAVDGVPVDRLPVREDYWSIQRWTQIDFDKPDGVQPGAMMSARVRIHLRVPGPLLSDGSPMPFAFDETRNVVIAEASVR
jgi:hypothetical protein